MKTTFTFLTGVGAQEIAVVILFLAVPTLLFLILRSVMLWYWKIDTLVNNQQKQIKLLSDLLVALKPQVKSEKITPMNHE